MGGRRKRSSFCLCYCSAVAFVMLEKTLNQSGPLFISLPGTDHEIYFVNEPCCISTVSIPEELLLPGPLNNVWIANWWLAAFFPYPRFLTCPHFLRWSWVKCLYLLMIWTQTGCQDFLTETRDCQANLIGCYLKNWNTFEQVFLDLHQRLFSSLSKSLDSIKKTKAKTTKNPSPGSYSVKIRLIVALKYYSTYQLLFGFQAVQHLSTKIHWMTHITFLYFEDTKATKWAYVL